MHLFKYFEPARLDVIESGCIRLTQPIDFNDPFELKPVTSTCGIKDAMPDLSSTEENLGSYNKIDKLPIKATSPDSEFKVIKANKNLLEEQQVLATSPPETNGVTGETSGQNQGEVIGVLCLTEEPDNLLMWSHYADSHQGFCVKFDTSNYFFNQKRTMEDDFYHLRKVEYIEQHPTKVIKSNVGVDLLLHKSDTWSHEKEWRFCAVLHDSDMLIECADSDIHLFKYPKEIIKEIILGANASEELADKIKTIIDQTPEFSHVKLSKAYIAEKSYRLEFKSL
ncbi:DUF2971 domain-containing protein [Psychromonas sp. SA13A]|uniref:DUF2971 domain-containing protein n=1 Tax=Psychromonas sp. SA13A TaxID=2686346 RepID=UPI001F0F6BCD|nr:DUF2971 domain-containing protein [Psychromonas sp. SA13A]